MALLTSASVSRRVFLQAAGLAAANVALGQRAITALADCAELGFLRSQVCAANAELEGILNQLLAPGLPLGDPDPPLSPEQVQELTDQAKAITINLAEILRHSSPQTLAQLASPEFVSFVEMAIGYNVPLVPTAAEIQANLFAPTNTGNIAFGSIGYVLFGILLAAVIGLDPAEIKAFLESGVLDGLVKLAKEFAEHLNKGDMPKARKALRGLVEGIGAAVKKLGGKLGKKILEKLMPKLALGWLGWIILAIALIKGVYDKWDEITKHL